MKWLDSVTNSMDASLNKFQEIVVDRGAWPAAVHGVTKNYVSLLIFSSEVNQPSLVQFSRSVVSDSL